LRNVVAIAEAGRCGEGRYLGEVDTSEAERGSECSDERDGCQEPSEAEHGETKR
jgi:hypothetical protein